MAAFTITAASVKKSTNAVPTNGTAGETITQGQPVYLAANGKYLLSDANGTPPANSVSGIALNGASLDQPISLIVYDPAFTTGFTMAVGDILIVGGTAPGDINPAADLVATWFPLVIGVAITTTTAIIQCGSQALKGTAAKA